MAEKYERCTSEYERGKVRWGIGDIALAVVICLGSFAAFFLVVGRASAATGEDGNLTLFAWLAAIAESVLLCAVWLIVVKKRHLPWKAVGIRLPVRGYSFMLAAAALLGSLAFTGAYAAAVSALGIDALVPEPLPAELAGEGAYILISALALGVWVPFVEEIFFRGFLFAGLAARYGLYVGVVASAALFALVHFSLATMLPIFVTGILFALVYHRTRSIWIPMSAHSAQNLLALLASRYALPALGGRVGDGLGII